MTEKKQIQIHGKLHTMKEACEETGLPYETLKFYCNKGLVPNVKRDEINRRVFDDKDIGWIKSLVCLKNCDMTLTEMKEYLDLCLQGPSSIPQRRVMLDKKRALLVQKLAGVQEAIDYIDWKQQFYRDVEDGKVEYVSNLLP
jgi:DNA-binding transcriptional MerR regulator